MCRPDRRHGTRYSFLQGLIFTSRSPEDSKTPGDCSPGVSFAKVASVFAIIRKTLWSRVLRLFKGCLRWAISARR
jgi:hypothetical protein